MLVFYRSADWCPYCKTQLASSRRERRTLAKNGIGLAAVSYDAVPILADFSKRRGITFPLLSDPGSATIKRYGILNTTVPETNQQSYGIPFPGTFMLNTQGVVTSRFFEQAYQERSTVGSIMARLGNNTDVQATTLSSPQLELTHLPLTAPLPRARNSLWSSMCVPRGAFTSTRQASRGTNQLLSRCGPSLELSSGACSIRPPRIIISSP